MIYQQDIENEIDEYFHSDNIKRAYIEKLIESIGEDVNKGWKDTNGKITFKDSLCGLTSLYNILYFYFKLINLDLISFILRAFEKEDIWLAGVGIKWGMLLKYGEKILYENDILNMKGAMIDLSIDNYIIEDAKRKYIGDLSMEEVLERKKIEVKAYEYIFNHASTSPIMVSVSRNLKWDKLHTHIMQLMNYSNATVTLFDPDKDADYSNNQPIETENNFIKVPASFWMELSFGINMLFVKVDLLESLQEEFSQYIIRSENIPLDY